MTKRQVAEKLAEELRQWAREGHSSREATMQSAAAVLMTQSRALDAIAEQLSGVEWSPDTAEVVARIVRYTGRTIAEVR